MIRPRSRTVRMPGEPKRRLTRLVLFLWTWTLAPVFFASSSDLAWAEERSPLAQIYTLETLEVRGSSRMTAEQMATELGLSKGAPLNDDLVMNARSQLLGLGLFKSVTLMMRKGTKPGQAKLIVEVEDAPDVLSDWALGGDFAVTAHEQSTPSGVESGAAPMDYQFGLISRNLFGQLHRGAVTADVDGMGVLRAGQVAYGLPRFAREGVQFDAEAAVVDTFYRYLETQGFGARGQSLWSESISNFSEVQYGAAIYTNPRPRFTVPGFPTTVLGPKIAFSKETRLHTFFPTDGYQIGSSLLLAPAATEDSIVELEAAKTWGLAQLLFGTIGGKILAVGTQGYSLRAENRLDIPLGVAAPGEDQAAAFILLRTGRDSIGDVQLKGAMAMIGVRYHSSGFIAELGLKITKSPDELRPSQLTRDIEGEP